MLIAGRHLLHQLNATSGSKLMPKWIGPFTVERMVGNAAARLILPHTMRCHNVFHVSLLKPYCTQNAEEDQETAPIEIDQAGSPVFEVEKVVPSNGHRQQR